MTAFRKTETLELYVLFHHQSRQNGVFIVSLYLTSEDADFWASQYRYEMSCCNCKLFRVCAFFSIVHHFVLIDCVPYCQVSLQLNSMNCSSHERCQHTKRVRLLVILPHPLSLSPCPSFPSSSVLWKFSHCVSFYSSDLTPNHQ